MSNPSPKRITRIATFRFKPTTTTEQKADRAKAFLALYKEHQDLIVALPVGGRPLETPLDLTNVKRDSVWDMGFTVTFKSGEARKEFDSSAGHEKLKNATDELLEQVFVYDFQEQENLGW